MMVLFVGSNNNIDYKDFDCSVKVWDVETLGSLGSYKGKSAL